MDIKEFLLGMAFILVVVVAVKLFNHFLDRLK